MSTQTRITFDSLAQAAEALQRLMMKLDSHQMYTDIFYRSEGACRDSIGMLMDEMDVLKTDLGRIIDGTRSALVETSSRFAEADAEAQRRIWKI